MALPPPAAATPGMSPELEQTLTMLSSHRAVLGYIMLGRGHPVSIVRHSGVIFEGEQGEEVRGRDYEDRRERAGGAGGGAYRGWRCGRPAISANPDKTTRNYDLARSVLPQLCSHKWRGLTGARMFTDDRYLLAVLYDPST
ncbi:Dynein light chain roadblock-type 2 [Mycena venus]|uniref:Dynein light chain roadblock-type 2 n=1 Tax=Mycena venus TaxID=2733690 RepID=A0A8H6YUL2_9AGAR|nr:Dynein light chain roadblock-type 2 [Mycena venus]